MARNQGRYPVTSGAVRVAVLHPARRTVVVYGNAIGEHDGMVAVNCDDGRALYVHPVNIRFL